MVLNNSNILILGNNEVLICNNLINCLIKNNNTINLYNINEQTKLNNSNILQIKREDLNKFDYDYIFILYSSLFFNNFDFFLNLANKTTSITLIMSLFDDCDNIFTTNIVNKYKKIKILKYCEVYGSEEDCSLNHQSIIHKLYNDMNNNMNIKLSNCVNYIHKLIYIKDLVDIIVNFAFSDKIGIFNILPDKSYSIKDIVEIFNELMNKNLKLDFCRNYNFLNKYNDIDISGKKIKYNNTSLKEGIQSYLKYLNRNKVLGIIIPFKNRNEHLSYFIPYIKNHLNKQKIKYKIFIIKQDDNKKFNRGLLKNFAMKHFFNNVDYFCLHNIRFLPEENIDYSYTYYPKHLLNFYAEINYFTNYIYGKLQFNNYNYKKYTPISGGVILFNKNNIVDVNGFSNDYFFWGWDDICLLNRINLNNLKIITQINRFLRITMEKKTSSQFYFAPNRYLYKYYDKFFNNKNSIKIDGINNCNQKIKIISEIKKDDDIYQINVKVLSNIPYFKLFIAFCIYSFKYLLILFLIFNLFR